MRLLTSRLARAFPELDRFDDAQADAFCRAAVRQFWPRMLRCVVVGVCGVVAVVLATLVAISMPSWIIGASSAPSSRLYNWTTVVSAIVLIILFGVGFLPTMLLRDWLLRRRVRVVIRERGTCPRCKYVLLGQPVSADLRVSCPECGLAITADPSMRELATDAEGRSIFKPEAPELDPALLARRAKWLRRIKLAAIWVPISTISAVLIAALVGWMFIVAQARRAQAIVASTPGKITPLIERAQPSGSTDADNRWHAVIKVIDAFTATLATAPTTTPEERQAGATLDMTSLVYPATPSDLPNAAQEVAATRAYSRRVFDAVRSSSIVEDLRVLEGIPQSRFVRPWSDPGPGAPMLGINAARSSLPQMRALARFNGARMYQAIIDKDRTGFERAMAQNLGLANGLRRQPMTLDVLVAMAIEALTLGIIEQYVPELAQLGWLESVQEQIAPLTAAPTDATAMVHEVAALEAVDAVARYFSDTARVSRVMTFREGLPGQIGGMPGGTPTNPWRVGTLDSNVEPLRDLGGKVATWAKVEPRDRPTSWIRTGLPTKGAAVAALAADPWVTALRSVDQLRLTARGVYTIIAIERFRSRKGKLPGSLAELTAADGVTAEVLIRDLHAPGPLKYRIVEAVSTPGDTEPPTQLPKGSRGCLLYSVGLDRTDNNGTPNASPYQALVPAGAGTDYLFGVNRD